MSCAVTLSNLTARAQDGSFGVFRYGTDRLTTNIRVLPAGTYTITADAPEGVTCYIHTAGSDGSDPADLPASGEYTLPVTLTLSKVSKVSMYFGYAGFRSAPFGTWTPIDIEDVTAVNAAKSGAPTADTYETVVLRPDEIPDSDTFAKAVNSKSTIMLTIFPQFEAWRFAKRGETLVRVIDLDGGGMIFRGRVKKINDRMSANGAQSQVLTCLSAADFLEDTGHADSIALQALGDWLGTICAEHNAKCELARRFTYTLTGAAKVSSGTDYIVKSHYKTLTDVLTGGKYLSQGTGAFKAGYTMEWRERYQNDATYIDIAEKLGEDKDTAILIGDNLREINIERGLDGGLYTSIMAVSGVCADGYRMAYVAYNDEMLTRYGDGRQLVVVNNDIYFTGEGGRDPRADGGYDWYSTPATIAAEAALKAFAEAEAAKLSDPPIKITLSAADLAKLGYSGYEPFEVGNTYPVVYPSGKLFGRRMRLTAITRRLSDGQIASMTVECGEKPSGVVSGSLSRQMALMTVELNGSGNEAKNAEIAETKAEEQTGGYTWDTMSKAEYDAMSEHDDKQWYVVDNDGTTEVYIGDDRITSQGGGGATIETAAVLSSEQMTEWAPEHPLVPVTFRGSANVYYAGAPAKMVMQGQRACFVTGDSQITENDVMSEVTFDFRDGSRRKVKVYLSELEVAAVASSTYYKITISAKEYDVSGASETLVVQSEIGTWGTYSLHSSLHIGFAVRVSGYYLNANDEMAPEYRLYAYVFADSAMCSGDSFSGYSVPYAVGGTIFSGRDVDFGSAAERGFALGISRRTEPSSS